MLVYIRESDKDKIICDVDEKDIAEHLRVSIFPWLYFDFLDFMCHFVCSNTCIDHIPDTFEERARRERGQEKI